MDIEPNCAICGAPPQSGCQCEAERLQIALDQAESRATAERMAMIRYSPYLMYSHPMLTCL